VIALSNRLLKDRMQCSYITGQKRIGKTSLANAVVDYVKGREQLNSLEFIYLEYGDYARKDADATVEAFRTSDFAVTNASSAT